MKRIKFILLLIFISIAAFAQERIDISGIIDWEKFQITSTVSLDLLSAGLRLPAGRNQAESILTESYTRLIRQAVLGLQVDSSSTILDLIERNELSLAEIDAITQFSRSVPSAVSQDLLKISSAYTLPIFYINSSLQRHMRPSQGMRTINPVSSVNYSGIIIVASEELPAHGMRRSYLPVPCLYPKIWDSEMNLIYERSMVTPQVPVARYSSPAGILQNTPSGLTPELIEIVGERPLRIFARGVFGIKPTDLIIDRQDALIIISNEQNRALLTEGKVVIILDQSMLRSEFRF